MKELRWLVWAYRSASKKAFNLAVTKRRVQSGFKKIYSLLLDVAIVRHNSIKLTENDGKLVIFQSLTLTFVAIYLVFNDTNYPFHVFQGPHLHKKRH